jgi:hypothetical protein
MPEPGVGTNLLSTDGRGEAMTLSALGSVLIAATHVRWILLLSISLLWWIVLGLVIYLAGRGAGRSSN